jgi:hypothetical protein
LKPVTTLILRTPILLLAIGIILPSLSYSQCSGALKSISYNTTINGTGNDYHSIIMPQFDPGKGTLVAVKISSVISLQYAFQLENKSASAASYTVGVGRNDYIGSTVLSSPLTNMNNILKSYGPYSLAASNGVTGSGPDYISVSQLDVLNNYCDISDSTTSGITNFLGTGNVEFDYYTTTYYNLAGNYSFNYNASDAISFSVSYYYCEAVKLKSDITSFDANYQSDNTINLSWQTANEQSGRVYTIQKSSDGINFEDAGSLKSNIDTSAADYSYQYNITTDDKNQIYFRLKVVDASNNVSYSEIRSVDLSKSPNPISLYPNPSNSFINIVFDHSINNWQIDIFTASGQLLQRNYFANTNAAHINFINNLAPGVYFIRAINQDLKKNYVLSFMTQ